MPRRAPSLPDDRQDFLFSDAPEIRVWRSDERALAEMHAILETLTAAKAHPWSARLLGWQVKTFETLALRVTPLEGEALRRSLEAQLDRLGPPGL